MTELALSFGAMLHLQVVGDRSANRLQARVLGYKPGESIIVDVPGTGFLPTELRLNDSVAARGLIGRHIIGFKCTVLRVCTSPYPYFHLSFPEAVERIALRQSERVAVAIPATITTASGAAVEAELGDLSASGAMLLAPTDLAAHAGDRVQIGFELTFAQVTRRVKLTAMIRNVSSASGSGGDPTLERIGVEFELAEEERLFVLSYVYECLAKTRGSVDAP